MKKLGLKDLKFLIKLNFSINSTIFKVNNIKFVILIR